MPGVCYLYLYCKRKEDIVDYPPKWEVDKDDHDYYLDQQRQTAYRFYAQRVKELKISELDNFLNTVDADEVVVLGHSMGLVDFEYMERIERRLHPRCWTVSYHKAEDIVKIQNIGYSFTDKMRFLTIGTVLMDGKC